MFIFVNYVIYVNKLVAQINLLKQKSSSLASFDIVPSILVKVFAGALIALVVYYGWIYIRINKTNAEIASIQEQIAQGRKDVVNTKERNELLTRQAQLKELNGVLGKHAYWSQIFPEIARVTLKTAKYSDIKASDEGDFSLSVEVPNISDFDKYLQVFDNPKFNANFSDLRVSGYHKSQDSEENMANIKFDVKMKYNSSILNYNPATTQN